MAAFPHQNTFFCRRKRDRLCEKHRATHKESSLSRAVLIGVRSNLTQKTWRTTSSTLVSVSSIWRCAKNVLWMMGKVESWWRLVWTEFSLLRNLLWMSKGLQYIGNKLQCNLYILWFERWVVQCFRCFFEKIWYGCWKYLILRFVMKLIRWGICYRCRKGWWIEWF